MKRRHFLRARVGPSEQALAAEEACSALIAAFAACGYTV